MSAPPSRRRSGSRRLLRVLLWLVLIAVTIVVLFTTVFPWVEQRLENPTMQAADPVSVRDPESVRTEREPVGQPS